MARPKKQESDLFVPFTRVGNEVGDDEEEEEIKRRKWKDTGFDQS